MSVCLHMHDIKIGRHKIFMAHGLPVYTVGANNGGFIARFYDILKNFSYMTSNSVTTPLYYAVEMGIPSFIYGEPPVFYNSGNANMPLGRYDLREDRPYYQKLYRLFSDLNCAITPEKRKIIETDLGIYDGISRREMAFVLYSSLFRWVFSAAFTRWLRDLIPRWQKMKRSS